MVKIKTNESYEKNIFILIFFSSDSLNEMYCEQTSPLDLSRTGKAFHYQVRSPSPCECCRMPLPSYSRQASIETNISPPLVVTQPKREWHYRSLKDLAKNHLPYLSGIGPQRTPVRVTVCYSFFLILSSEYIYLLLNVSGSTKDGYSYISCH